MSYGYYGTFSYNNEMYKVYNSGSQYTIYKSNNILSCVKNNSTITWTQINTNNINQNNRYSDMGATDGYVNNAVVFNNKLYICTGWCDHANWYRNCSEIIEYDASTNKCNIISAYGSYRYCCAVFVYNGKLMTISSSNSDGDRVPIVQYTFGGTRPVMTEIGTVTSSSSTYRFHTVDACSCGGYFYTYYEESNSSSDYASRYFNMFEYNGTTLTRIASSSGINANKNGRMFIYNNLPCFQFSDSDHDYNNAIYTFTIKGQPYQYLTLTQIMPASPGSCYYACTIGDYLFDRAGYAYQISSKVYDPQTLIIQRNTSNNGTYKTGIYDLKSIVDESLQPLIEGDANRCLYGFDDCYYFADTAFDWNAPMYYGDGSQWIKFKN